MKIQDIMQKNPITVTEKDSVISAAELMQKNDVGAIPVTDKNGTLKGIITDRDIILRCVSKNLNPQTTLAADIMTKNVLSVCPENSVTESSRIMAKNQIRRLPVCKNRRLVGIVSLGDISRSKLMFAETASAFCDICENKDTNSNHTNF
ncbi:MAG: CBS domain-containing protein [Clostridia bacterium]|nr:CBS domain-containing protein [Clostridia bacterium]